MSRDHRLSAQSRIESLAARLREQQPTHGLQALIDECEALSRAIGAFHLEGIRFRMYNVDRMLHRSGERVPSDALEVFAAARRELEAAGFHTRSHQAPG